MAFDDDSAQRVKGALRDDANPDAGMVRQRLDEVLGSGWTEDLDGRLAEYVAARATEDESARLTGLAAAGDVAGMGVWLDEFLARIAAGDQQDGEWQDTAGPRFQNIAGVDGYPGWWVAFDTAEPDADGGYKYARGTEPPDDATTEWLAPADAFIAMQAEATAQEATAQEEAAPADGPRFVNVAPVDGYPGWWVAFDTAEPDADGGYKYARGTEPPDDATTQWLSQADAFAAMQEGAEAVPAQAGPDEVATDDGEAGGATAAEPAVEQVVAEQMVTEVVTTALAEVDGAEELSAEDILRAIEEATTEMNA